MFALAWFQHKIWLMARAWLNRIDHLKRHWNSKFVPRLDARQAESQKRSSKDTLIVVKSPTSIASSSLGGSFSVAHVASPHAQHDSVGSDDGDDASLFVPPSSIMAQKYARASVPQVAASSAVSSPAPSDTVVVVRTGAVLSPPAVHAVNHRLDSRQAGGDAGDAGDEFDDAYDTFDASRASSMAANFGAGAQVTALMGSMTESQLVESQPQKSIRAVRVGSLADEVTGAAAAASRAAIASAAGLPPSPASVVVGASAAPASDKSGSTSEVWQFFAGAGLKKSEGTDSAFDMIRRFVDDAGTLILDEFRWFHVGHGLL